MGLQKALNKTLPDIISWYKANFPSLNFNKTYLEFRTKNCIDTTLDINDCNISIANDTYTEFLGLVIDGPLALDNPYPTAFPYGNGMVLHFYQQQESSTNKTVHKVINKGLKAYVKSPHTGENCH